MRHRLPQRTSTTIGLRGRCALAAALATVGLAVAMPAAAEDNPPAPEPPKGCSYYGVTVPNGTSVSIPVGSPPLPGAAAGPGVFVCLNGMWFPAGMESGPSVTVDDVATTVAEGATATNSGTFSYAGDAPVAFSASVGAVTGHADGTWSWSYSATDGPAQSQSVLVTATADGKVGEATFNLTVDNVAPQIVSVTPDRTTALVGEPVIFLGEASDMSADDTLAGFTWAFEGTTAAGDTVTTSFSECGAGTVTATAADKDGGTSAVATSGAVAVVAAQFAAPLRAGSYNLVQAGQVVPIRVVIGCDGVAAAGLSPSIQLLSGDIDPATDADDPAQSVAATTVSSADTTGVMRSVDGAYLYNLRVPKAPANSLFTVRVRPFGDSTAAVYAVLKVR